MTREQQIQLSKDLSGMEVVLDRWAKTLYRDVTISIWICRGLAEASAKISVCKDIVDKVTVTL